mgnify:CR=1 FL=1
MHLVIADDARFREVLRRLKVRYAALPTDRLPIYAERFQGGHLPDCLEVLRTEPQTGITIFRVREDALGPASP